jgi:hypothetical protein
MSQPLINILIRVSRPALFERCMNSILIQTYQNYKVHIHKCTGAVGYSYNLYCNDLKAQVKDGWFFYLDDDDILLDRQALERISRYLLNEDHIVICQMLRNGVPKPSDRLQESMQVHRGKIGMPCFLLHAKHKNVAHFVATEDADFRFIRAAIHRLSPAFCKEVLVNAGGRGHGLQNPTINHNEI